MIVKPKILIVEDQTAVAMTMVYLLTQAGCETEVAATGKKAMQKAEAGEFDLITLDVDLPDASGFKICSRLKENPHLHDTPVVFVSGHPHEECQQRAVELGAVDYIIKPFDALDFASRILSHVEPEKNLAC
jgi:two-component system catabolic regulation response regulator CreB